MPINPLDVIVILFTSLVPIRSLVFSLLIKEASLLLFKPKNKPVVKEALENLIITIPDPPLPPKGL